MSIFKSKAPTGHGYRMITNGRLFAVESGNVNLKYWARVSQYLETKKEAATILREFIEHYEKHAGPWEPTG